MSPELIRFLKNNKDLINENTKESWKKIYNRIDFRITGEFTETLLNTGISDPAAILGYIPDYYLHLYDPKIQEYKIPDNVTSIGRSAFAQCKSLTTITIPNSVTSVKNGAFYNCSGLTSVVIGDNVTSIGDRAFCNCSRLTSVVIGDSVESIGVYAFYNCSSLTNLVIPDSVTRIGDFAFSDCSSLTSIVIPDSVTSIGKFAFQDCDNITQLQYKGTKEQAMKLKLRDKQANIWGVNNPPPFSKIICSDGVIEL